MKKRFGSLSLLSAMLILGVALSAVPGVSAYVWANNFNYANNIISQDAFGNVASFNNAIALNGDAFASYNRAIGLNGDAFASSVNAINLNANMFASAGQIVALGPTGFVTSNTAIQLDNTPVAVATPFLGFGF